jgi:hypothetical protein
MNGTHGLAAMFAAVVLLCASGRAVAQDDADEGQPRHWALDAGFGTHFPLSVGGEVTAELPGRLLLQLHLGYLPPGYARAVGGASRGFGADDLTAELLESGLAGSFVVRSSVGWRPFRRAGFEIMGGYSRVAMDARVSASDVVEEVTGQPLPGNDRTASVGSTLHALHLTLGWRAVIADHFVLRFSVGYLHAIGASSRVSLDQEIPGFGADQIAAAERLIDSSLERYAQTVTLQAVAAYRF